MKDMTSMKRQGGFFGVGVGLLLFAVFGGITLGTDGKKQDQYDIAGNDQVEIAQSISETY